MKVNELRVDNFILFKEWGKGRGKIGQMKRGDFGRFNDEEYHPVQITPKWLERFGFVAEIIEPITVPSMWSITTSNGYSLRLRKRDFYFVADCDLPVALSGVHQLQNLYFALTGDELQIKMP